MSNQKEEELYSSGDAAKYLGVSLHRFNKLAVQYKISHRRTGVGRIFRKTDILAFQKSAPRVHNLRFQSKTYRKQRRKK